MEDPNKPAHAMQPAAGSHDHAHATGHAHTHATTNAAHQHAPATHTPTPAHAPISNVPTTKAWAIGLVIVLLIATLGFLLYQKISTAPAVEPHAGNRVQVQLLVDTQCEFCDKNNSILIKFAQSHIQYDVELIDIFSEEGKALAAEYDVNFSPTAIFSVAGLDQNVEIQYAIQRLYPTKNGHVVFPEAFLDDQPRTLSYINNATCAVEPGKIRIDAYVDFACKPCAEAYFILKTLENKFPQIEAYYTPVQYRRFTQQSIDIALNNNRGAICAEQMGYYRDYIDCAFLNIQFGGVQDINSMKACLSEAGGRSKSVQNDFVACVADENKTTQNKLLENINQAVALRTPAQFTPSFVFDCKYSFVGHNDLPLFLCVTHPELQGCTDVLKAGPTKDQNVDKGPQINIYIPDQNVHVTTQADAN